MTSFYMNTSTFLNKATTHKRLLEDILKEVNTNLGKHQSNAGALDEDRNRALDELTEAYLPSLTAEAIATVPKATGYHQFEAKDPLASLQQRRNELSARIVAIETDERYINRDKLIHPVVGELVLLRDETQRNYNLFAQSVERYEKDGSFKYLYSQGYGTDAYKEKWWNLLDRQYFRDWKAGDEVVEKFSSATDQGPSSDIKQLQPLSQPEPDFDDVRAAYERLLESKTSFGEDLAAINRKIADVENLISERESLISSLESIVPDTLAECRNRLREHLEYIDRADLAAWASGNEHLTGILKRLHGIEKKREYLDELAKNYLEPERQQLTTAVSKLAHNVRITTQEANGWLRDPRPKLKKRHSHYTTVYNEVYTFNRYDWFDYQRDLLWWHLMTGNRYDGAFIPEVQAWQVQHPDSRTHPAADYDHAGATISAAGMPVEADDDDPTGIRELAEAS
jgi:hypothetical protein